MFKDATFRLTTVYLMILAFISLYFSINWYNGATTQLAEGLDSQRGIIERRLDNGPRESFFKEIREQEIEKIKSDTLQEIVVANVILLSVGGYLSFVLAKKTLSPIQKNHRAQARFIADASHELRTPISVMRTELEVALKDKSLAKDAKDILKSSLSELDGLQKMVEELLQTAKLDAHQDEINTETVNIRSLIENAVGDYKKAAEGKDIKLHINVEDTSITTEETSLKQIIGILLDNAIKYSPKKSEIMIEGESLGDTYRISINDEGVGIKASDQKRIFERFYRVNNHHSKDVSGSGLGLPIAKQLAQRIDANLYYKPNSNGSTFVCELPK